MGIICNQRDVLWVHKVCNDTNFFTRAFFDERGHVKLEFTLIRGHICVYRGSAYLDLG